MKLPSTKSKNQYKKKLLDLRKKIKSVEKEIQALTSYDSSSKRETSSHKSAPVEKNTNDRKRFANYLGAGSIQTVGMHKYHRQDIINKSIYIVAGTLFVLLLIWLIFR